MEDRKQEINKLLDSLTLNEIDEYIKDRHIIDDKLKKMLEKIKSNRPDNHSQKIFKNLYSPINKSIEDIYKLGIAAIISQILYYYNDNYKISELHKYLKDYIKQDEILKEYVYEIMKDFK